MCRDAITCQGGGQRGARTRYRGRTEGAHTGVLPFRFHMLSCFGPQRGIQEQETA